MLVPCILALYEQNAPSVTVPFQAVALLAASSRERPNSESFRNLAVKSYGSSVRCINQAMLDPAQSLTDAALIGAFLISLAEKYNASAAGPLTIDNSKAMLARSNRALAQWFGMIRIINMRGMQLLQTLTGRQIVMAICWL